MTSPLTRAAVGGEITAGMFDQLVDAIQNPPVAKVLKSGAQSLSGTINTNSAVVWDVEQYDAFNMHDNTTNPTRMTIPAGWGGYYRAITRVRSAQTTGTFTAQFAINGTIQTSSGVRVGAFSSGAFTQTSDDFLLSAGDYVEVFMQSDQSGPALVPTSCAFSLAFFHW